MKLAIPAVVRDKALAAGHGAWLAALPALADEVAHTWSLTLGAVYAGGSEAVVLEAAWRDAPAVLKLCAPRDDHPVRHEIAALRRAGGDGCVRLLRDDAARGALLLERLGPSLASLALPLAERHAILCDALARVWRPAPDAGLPTGAAKGRWLIDYIAATWDALDRPCSRRAVDDALACARRRIADHDDARAVLAHGDAHAGNALAAGDGFRLIDPDGLLAEPAYDLGILMREDPGELLAGDPWARARWLAARTGVDATAIWEWGVVERVSTGLACTQIGLQPAGRELLAAADLVAAGA